MRDIGVSPAKADVKRVADEAATTTRNSISTACRAVTLRLSAVATGRLGSPVREPIDGSGMSGNIGGRPWWLVAARSGVPDPELKVKLTTEKVEKDGFRVVGAARDEAERLVVAVRRFHGESGHEVGPAQAEAIVALCLDASLGRAWLLTDGRRDVGYALAYWRHSIDHGGCVAVLDDLWVQAGLRGRGLGTHLLRAALAGMSESAARAVVVEADPADAPAMSFYGRLGFAPKGTTLLVGALPPTLAPAVAGC